MKTVNILPVKKKSKLLLYNRKFIKGKNYSEYPSLFYTNHHIYITSSNVLKEEGWYLYPKSKDKVLKKLIKKPLNKDKIVLTTDQDLIKDGVRPIEDNILDFLLKSGFNREIEVIEPKPINNLYPDYVVGELLKVTRHYSMNDIKLKNAPPINHIVKVEEKGFNSKLVIKYKGFDYSTVLSQDIALERVYKDLIVLHKLPSVLI